MALDPLLDALAGLGAYARLSQSLPSGRTTVRAAGLVGSSDAALVSALARSHPTRFFVVVAGALADA